MNGRIDETIKRPMNTVNIEHIAFAYGKEQIFQDLSADFADCEFCALMGPNGSGKSTLLKCIGRMLPFTNGDIKVNGKSIQEYESTELAKLVSYVPQHQDNVFDVSVYDLVMMGSLPLPEEVAGCECAR